MRTGEKGLDLIKSFEGLRLESYQDSAGVWTIGHGHTKGVGPGQTCSYTEADRFLKADLKDAEDAVNELVKDKLAQPAFDALVSFAFNLGRGALARSQLLRLVNSRAYEDAALEFPRFCNAGGRRLRGLLRRRFAEAALFLEG